MLILALAALLLAAYAADRGFDTWSEKSASNKQSTTCRDAEGACSDWAEKGECERNPGFMQKSCRLACKLCEAPPVDPAAYHDQMLLLNCSLGQIRVRPLFDSAPLTAALVLELANAEGGYRGCTFYRNEAVPQDGSGGPPYGLLQGSLSGLLRVPDKEGPPVDMKRGHVAMIPGTREFFLSAMDHGAWGASMTVFGEVADAASMAVVEAALQLPYHEVKHPTYGTVMRMLDHPLPFMPLAVSAWGGDGDSGWAADGGAGEELASSGSGGTPYYAGAT